MWWYDGGTGDGVIAPGGKVQPLDAGKAGRGRAAKGRFRGRDLGMKAGGGRLCRPQTLGPSGGVVAGLSVSGGFWFGAAVRVCQAFSSPS